MVNNELQSPVVFNTTKPRSKQRQIPWSDNAIADFKAKYPTSFNSDLAIEFQCDVRTILRIARLYNVEKEPNFSVKHKQQIIERISLAKSNRRLNHL